MEKETPLQDYLRAFMVYSRSLPSAIQIKKYFNHAIVSYKGDTYQISTSSDLVEDYRDYFTRENFDEIYTQTHEGVFQCMLEENDVEIEPGEFIIEIYNRWVSYWNSQKSVVKTQKFYNELKGKSYEELQILIQAIKINYKDAIKYASKLNANEFIPIVTLVIKDQFDDIEEFLDRAIEQLTAHGEAFLTMGNVFEEVYLGGELEDEEEESETYYIYNPMFDYDDYNEDS